MEEELEAERQAHQKSDTLRATLVDELDKLGQQLEEAQDAASTQADVNNKLETSVARLQFESDQRNSQHDLDMQVFRKRHAGVLDDLQPTTGTFTGL